MRATPPATPRVSVLIAVRDGEAWLGQALRSVARQSLADWECVVVDDGSRRPVDLPSDPRFRLLRIEAAGVVEARNRGLELCRGELVALLDADDVMRTRRLERQVAALEREPDWAGAGTHVRYHPRGSLGDGMLAYEAWLNRVRTPQDVRRESWIEMPLGHPTLMLRTDALRAAGGWRDRGWPEDWDLLLRLVHGHGRTLGVVRERLLAWRVRPKSLSRSGGAYSTEAFQRCRAHFLARHFLGDETGYVLWGYGSTGRSLRRELERLERRPTHVVEVHPRRLGNRIHGAPVVAPADLVELRPSRIVVSVAGARARRLIRDSLASMGFCEGPDYVCTA